ncbi:hypothetical protein [Sphingomonas sp.]|uniref:hypothetical protein n=1 Tax=Sphingomonas sp. TaxID=28214 RepID=UPI003BAC1194
MMRGPVLTAEHPTRGHLFAAVDPAARFVTPAVEATRFAARLKPFANEADAQAALDAELGGN